MVDAQDDLAGRWLSRGYGWMLDVAPSGFTVFDITPLSRIAVDRGAPGSFAVAFEIVGRTGADAFQARHRGDVTTYSFDRSPAGFAVPAEDVAIDHGAERSFEVLWRTFADHYAFFGLRAVDWERSYRRIRPKVVATMDEDSLRGICAELIAPLRDAHVSIAAGDVVLDATSPVRDRKIALQKAFGVPAWASDRQAYTSGIQKAFGEMFLGGRFRATSNTMMIYGEIAPEIGYVTIFGEFGHADTARSRAALDLPRSRLEAASFLADETAAIETALDEVAAGLAHTRAVIVDARLNYGGYDRLSLVLAGRFVDRPCVAYRKKAWTQGGFVNHQAIEVAPRALSLAGRPVYLLTSRQTASAGEILVLAMMGAGDITRVGEATLGILSDNLYKRLPNGWEVSLSNEVYEASDGALYEGVGIPPDVETVVFDPADVRGGFRHAVDKAAALAQKKLRP
jgi:carboxyl-terminal processing protease